MPSSSLPTSTRSPAVDFRDKAWILVVIAALAYFTWDTGVRWRHIREVSGTYGVTVDAPAVDRSSPTGYADGKRSLLLPDRDLDGYHWIMQAQQASAEGLWRMRHVDYDGAPTGRDVHWAAPFRWWVRELAGIDRAISGAPAGITLERAAVFSGPILLGLLILGFTPVIARRCSGAAAAFFAAGLVTMLPLTVDFVAGYADHHGLANTCALLSVLCFILASDTRQGSLPWVIASGVAGGFGLWISAATQLPVLLGLGLGGATACWVGRGAEPGNAWTRHPTFFRIWGGAGAGVSILGYLYEYAPFHFGFRLEVNHPLYAIAWLAAGETLCRLAWLACGSSPVPRRWNLLAGGLATALVATPAIVLWAGGETVFRVANPFLWQLHHEYIAEFQSLPTYLSRADYSWAATSALWPLAVLVFAAVAISQRRSRFARSQLVMALGPALVVLPLMLAQVRWWGLECTLLLPLFVVVGRRMPAAGTAGNLLGTLPPFGTPAPVFDLRRWALVGGTVLLLPGVVAALGATVRAAEIGVDDLHALAERDVAHWLRQRAGHQPVVVAASPSLTTTLVYHGGLRGVGTLYWENLAGLKSAADLYAAPTDEQARAIVKRCGITHLVVASWDGFEGVYARLARGVPADQPIPRDAFIVRLLSAPVPPPWLQLVPFTLPGNPAFAQQQVRVYEVVPDLSPALAMVRTADFLLGMNRVDDAQKLVPELAAFPDEPAVTALRVELAMRRHDQAAYSRAASVLQQQLAGNPPLALSDRVRVANAMAAAGQYYLAKQEVDRALENITEHDLRQLSPDNLVNLLAQMKAVGATWPNDRLLELADSLIPPSRRK
ncbi:MAG TPA: tetratricopeptide repeat protein [Opitutaceae bacterium]|nr:tetratricopeptide repeat protein [Opitutaceae bacterium]